MVLAPSAAAAATTTNLLFGGSSSAARRAHYQPILDHHRADDRDHNDDGDDDHHHPEAAANTNTSRGNSDAVVTPLRRQKQQQQQSSSTASSSSLSSSNRKSSSRRGGRPAPNSWADFFFGFLYEDEDDDDCDNDVSLYHEGEEDDDESPVLASFWRHVPPLHWALSAHLFLLAASAASAVTVASAAAAAASAAQQQQQEDTTTKTSELMARMTSAAVLGTALGKLCLGSVPDVVGARRTAFRAALGVAAAWMLILLAPTTTSNSMMMTTMMARGQFWMEFGNAVQWPCTVVVLAAHHQQHQHSSNNHSNSQQYEAGIFLTSLASRLGSLAGMVVSSRLLLQRHQQHDGWHWRVVAGAAGWCALVAASICYLHVHDAPDGVVNAPQNPVDPHLLKLWFPPHRQRPQQNHSFWKRLVRYHQRLPLLCLFVVRSHTLPALRRILGGAPTVWILALAHTGGLVVRTSERVLPQYARATAMSATASSSATTTATTTTNYLAVGSSVGTVLGLIALGRVFAAQQASPRARKWMVWRLYLVAVAACYVLAVLAVPAVHRLVGDADLVRFWQLLACAVAGCCVAVPCYHIPSLVAAGFGRDKGLFLACADGIAYGLASLVWKFVLGRTSANGSGGSSSSGWAYGWAAVALLLLVSGVTMTEFMEHYFCRPRHGAGGTYETIILA